MNLENFIEYLNADIRVFKGKCYRENTEKLQPVIRASKEAWRQEFADFCQQTDSGKLSS